MVRYKPKSVSEMEEHYRFKQLTMRIDYDRRLRLYGDKMAAQFKENYEAIRYSVVEFVRKISEKVDIYGQEAIVLQNRMSQLISAARSTRYKATIRDYANMLASTVFTLWNRGVIPDDVVTEIYNFLVQNGVPSDILSDVWRAWGLPMPA